MGTDSAGALVVTAFMRSGCLLILVASAVEGSLDREFSRPLESDQSKPLVDARRRSRYFRGLRT